MQLLRLKIKQYLLNLINQYGEMLIRNYMIHIFKTKKYSIMESKLIVNVIIMNVKELPNMEIKQKNSFLKLLYLIKQL